MDVREVLAREPRIEDRPCYGIIAESATDFADLLPVILPEFDEHLTWGPCRWQSRDSVTLPVAGDECLVIFDNRRDPWIAVWWPFA